VTRDDARVADADAEARAAMRDDNA